ncbi:MAG: hypothetical protein ACREWJ_06000 [Rhodoferax sp.]
MKKFLLPVSFALAQMLAVGAFAQNVNGQASPAQVAPPAHTDVTPAQKMEARSARKSSGAMAAKDMTPQVGDMKSAGTAHKHTRAERKAAHAKRKAKVTAEQKKGEITAVPGEASTAK